MQGTCCPGKTNVRRIRVGGLEIGIAELESVIKNALEMRDSDDEEIRRILLEQIKIYNYVPKSAEREYADAVWTEFQKARESNREARK